MNGGRVGPRLLAVQPGQAGVLAGSSLRRLPESARPDTATDSVGLDAIKQRGKAVTISQLSRARNAFVPKLSNNVESVAGCKRLDGFGLASKPVARDLGSARHTEIRKRL